MVKLDAASVGLGAVAAMAVGIPVAAIGSVVLDDGSNFAFFFYVLALTGFLFGGAVAGFRQPDTPMAHGAVAAFAGFAVAQAISALLQVARDESVHVGAVAFNAMLATNLGLLGGLAGAKRREAAT